MARSWPPVFPSNPCQCSPTGWCLDCPDRGSPFCQLTYDGLPDPVPIPVAAVITIDLFPGMESWEIIFPDTPKIV